MGLIVIGVVTFLLLRMAKKRKLKQQQQLEEQQESLQEEIEQRKRMLRETAEAKNNKDNAITNEIRDFAKQNPEITANLIRAWLKEDE